MKYISTFSGVEAASQAWRPLGWEPLCFAEVEPFPCAVLAERFPGVPNLGDVTKVDWSPYKGQADLMVGGSPCFPAGTPVVVRRPDGSAAGVPIEGVRAGDEVLTHKGRFRKVLATGSKVADTVLLRTDDGVGDALECTPNHPFLSVRMLGHGACGPRDDLEWVPASGMVGRCALAVNVDGGPLYDPVRVLSVSEGRRGVRVYNMSVEEDESYTAWGLAVHNCQSFSIAGRREGLDGSCGRTSRGASAPAEGRISDACSKAWTTSGMTRAGACWTRASSESPSGAVASSLSEVLQADGEDGTFLARYFLSPRACLGILERARRRDRELPAELDEALRRQASSQTPPGSEGA